MIQTVRVLIFGGVLPAIYFVVYVGIYVICLAFIFLILGETFVPFFDLDRVWMDIPRRVIIVYSVYFSILFIVRIYFFYRGNTIEPRWISIWTRSPKMILVDILGVSWARESYEDY